MRNKKKFKKVVRYYYPNGDEFKVSCLGFYFSSFFVMMILWIFYPLFYIFDKDNEFRGNREVYWEEVK